MGKLSTTGSRVGNFKNLHGNNFPSGRLSGNDPLSYNTLQIHESYESPCLLMNVPDRFLRVIDAYFLCELSLSMTPTSGHNITWYWFCCITELRVFPPRVEVKSHFWSFLRVGNAIYTKAKNDCKSESTTPVDSANQQWAQKDSKFSPCFSDVHVYRSVRGFAVVFSDLPFGKAFCINRPS